jgi:hypothetical protein
MGERKKDHLQPKSSRHNDRQWTSSLTGGSAESDNKPFQILKTSPRSSSSRLPQTTSGPSTAITSTFTRPSASILQALVDTNIPEIKPAVTKVKPSSHSSSQRSLTSAGSRENAILILSSDEEEDDEVLALAPSQVPQEYRRRPTNQQNPFTVSDDDKPGPSSRPMTSNLPKRLAAAGPSSQTNPVFEGHQKALEKRKNKDDIMKRILQYQLKEEREWPRGLSQYMR